MSFPMWHLPLFLWHSLLPRQPRVPLPICLHNVNHPLECGTSTIMTQDRLTWLPAKFPCRLYKQMLVVWPGLPSRSHCLTSISSHHYDKMACVLISLSYSSGASMYLVFDPSRSANELLGWSGDIIGIICPWLMETSLIPSLRIMKLCVVLMARYWTTWRYPGPLC